MKNKIDIFLLLSICIVLFIIALGKDHIINVTPGEGTVVNIFTSTISDAENMDTNFIDDKIYGIIKDAYKEVDFYGEFKKGNMEIYDLYREQYLKLVSGEATFFDKTTDKEYYINEFKEMDYTYAGNLIKEGDYANVYDPNNYVYYFFDVDNDGLPELCISNEIRFIYIFKYDINSSSFSLWYEIPTTWIRLMGTNKLWFYGGGSPVEYAYWYLDKEGVEICSVRFYLEGYHNKETKLDDTAYMVSLPQFTNVKLELTKDMEGQAILDKQQNIYYFRVTEQQWNELTEDFFEARRLAETNIEEVTFSYQELFTSKLNNKKSIYDITRYLGLKYN